MVQGLVKCSLEGMVFFPFQFVQSLLFGMLILTLHCFVETVLQMPYALVMRILNKEFAAALAVIEMIMDSMDRQLKRFLI